MTQILTVFEDIICTLRYINQAIVMINRYFVTYFLLHEITTKGEKILEKDFCWTAQTDCGGVNVRCQPQTTVDTKIQILTFVLTQIHDWTESFTIKLQDHLFVDSYRITSTWTNYRKKHKEYYSFLSVLS